MTGPRIAALVKQVPKFEDMTLGPDGRLNRDGVELEMNPYCRRAVSAARDFARTNGGESVVITLGPPSAEDSLREAIACGIDRGVLFTDPSCAGSDTLATAVAIERLLDHLGGFDLVLVGKNSVDADTGQVGPELAELLDWPFAGPVKELEVDFDGCRFNAHCETDDGFRNISGDLPAVLAAAERLTAPSKAPPDDRADVDAVLITTVTTSDVGGESWGAAASPTRVGDTRIIEVGRTPQILAGAVDEQVARALDELRRRGALEPEIEALDPDDALYTEPIADSGQQVWAVVDAAQKQLATELAQEAVRLAHELAATSTVISYDGHLGAQPRGVAELVELRAAAGAADEDYAAELAIRVGAQRPDVVIAPSTSSGREIASRVAASLGLGLTGDAVELDIVDGRLVAWKPAFGGRLVAAITSTSDVQMATVRPGVLPIDRSFPTVDVARETVDVKSRGRVEVSGREVTDDLEILATAHAVVSVGMGVEPDEYSGLDELRAALGAELAATRKVTDRGWLPRSRQIGITGRSVTPRLFVSIGASGKFNHSCGFRAAETVLAINPDASAPVFEHCDIGIVADWHEAVPLIVECLAR